jgi:S-adenosylmethionine hydrolase
MHGAFFFAEAIPFFPAETAHVAVVDSGVVAVGTTIRRWVRTYGEAVVGECVALGSSGGWLEIAVVQGNAARRLNLGRGAAIRVETRQEMS